MDYWQILFFDWQFQTDMPKKVALITGITGQDGRIDDEIPFYDLVFLNALWQINMTVSYEVKNCEQHGLVMHFEYLTSKMNLLE